MKFGEHLQNEIFPPWRLSYISYDALKKDLKSRQLDHKWTADDEVEFVNRLQNELEKVYDFVSAKLAEVEARISYCERTIQSFMNSPASPTDEDWTLMEDALTEVLFDVNDLSKFTRLNYIGFQKIIKKHDKWTGLNLKQDFIPQLRSRPLDKQRFDVAIVFISALHDICRQRGKPRNTNSLIDINTSSTEDNNTVKFWVHPDNITEVKSIIMLHLPVYIHNKEKRYDPSDSAVSNVYLDNDQFGLYTSLLQRDEHAESIRLKWHGPTSNPDVLVERSTHSTEYPTIKDRIQLLSEDVHKFISGSLTSDEFANRLMAKGTDPTFVEECRVVAAGIQNSIKDKNLKPVCRVFYNRTTFEQPENPTMRIHMDSDVTFIREDNFNTHIRRGPEDWRRPDVGIDYPFNYLDEHDILRFPYAVLETKLEKNSPQWLKKLFDSHLVHEVPRFSKYLHGASYLFRDRIPLLPWWSSEMQIDIRKPRSSDFGLSRSKSFKPLIDGQYRRAMEAEQLRMDIVNEDMKSTESTLTAHSSEKLKASQLSSTGENRVHRMRSTLVTKGDDPLNYGPPVRIKRADRADGVLGEEINFNNGDIRLDMGESNEKGARKMFGATNMYVKDPNDPNGLIPVKKVKVEPKVFFSNERTFISWLQFCALLLSVALNLLNFGDNVSRIAGAIFIGIAAGIAIYALFQFERRAWYVLYNIYMYKSLLTDI